MPCVAPTTTENHGFVDNPYNIIRTKATNMVKRITFLVPYRLKNKLAKDIKRSSHIDCTANAIPTISPIFAFNSSSDKSGKYDTHVSE